MIEDTRLFSANNPIGRLWYFINLFALAFLAVGVHLAITQYILPSVTPSFTLPIKVILYFSYIIFTITFFMLIDRRLYDVCGSRDSQGYRFVSKIINLIIILFILAIIAFFTGSNFAPMFYQIIEVSTGVFGILVLILGLIPGKSN